MSDEIAEIPMRSTEPAQPAGLTGEAELAGPEGSAQPAYPAAQALPHRRKRRSWKWWLANLMIVGGVLVLVYPLSTCGYTWYQQRELRQQLEEANPQIAAAGVDLRVTDFVPIEPQAAGAGQASTDAAGGSLSDSATTPEAAAAAGEYQAQFGAFEAAADTFAASVGGQTGEPIGKILMPSIGMDVIMVEGTGKGDLREGPGHWPETPFPGQGGNFVVSGHRTTYGAPFLKLDKVELGDEIDLVLPYAVARYTVTRVIVVDPDQVEEVAQLGREQVSLAACHPLLSAKRRIVVQGDLTGFKLTEPQN